MDKNFIELVSSLEKIIAEWMDGEPLHKLTLYVGDRTAFYMACAAVSVLFACDESQNKALDDGEFVRSNELENYSPE